MKYFISGHRDVKEEEFERTYVKRFLEVLEKDPNPEFVVGDYEGVDFMAQKWLVEHVRPEQVTVYHMFERPRHLGSEDFKLKGGFTSDEERDSAMTRDSDIDIAFLREGKRKSGTAQNILRRLEVL